MFRKLTIILFYVLFLQCNSQLCTRDQKLVQDRAQCLARKFDPLQTQSDAASLSTSVFMPNNGNSVDCFDCDATSCDTCEMNWKLECQGAHGATKKHDQINGCSWNADDEFWFYNEQDQILHMQPEYTGRGESFGCIYTSPFGAQAGMIVVGFAGFCLLLIIAFAFIAKKCGIDCRRVQDKYTDLQAKFFLGEVHLVVMEDDDGKLKWSFWSSYFALLTSTVPILGTWFIRKSHFSSRLDKAVVLLFSISYGMLAELVVVLYPDVLHPSYVFKFLVVTLPNAVLWNKLSERFDRESTLVDYQHRREELGHTSENPLPENRWAEWLDRAKNMFFIIFSLCICVVTYIKLQEESNPKCFVVNFLFNAIVVAFCIQAIKLYVDFYCKWSCVIDNYDTLGKGTWQRKYLDIAASLPPSADCHPLKKAGVKKEDPPFYVRALRRLKAVFCCCCRTNASESKDQQARQLVIEEMKQESFNNLKHPSEARGAIAEGEAIKKSMKVLHADIALRVIHGKMKKVSHDSVGDVEEADQTALLKELFNKIDKNGDGKVSRTEFMNALHDQSAADQIVVSQALMAAWNDTDRDGDNFLTQEEFENILSNLSATIRERPSVILVKEPTMAEKNDTEENLSVKQSTTAKKKDAEDYSDHSELTE